MGAAAVALLLFLTFGTLIAVALQSEGVARLSAADWAAVRFTLLQAFLSAVVSVALAIPVARGLARRQFWGRSLLITLLGAPFILPVVVAIIGLIAVFGRTGVLSDALAIFGLPPVQIYGLHGVVLAHVFFNLPLATRLFLQGWLSIPAERFRLAASLNFGPADMRRVLEYPMLRKVGPGAFMLIFLLCMTSFAVALTLGGGPKATTVELAIYQAFRFDFDLSKAALLAMVQFGLCAAIAIAAFWVTLPASMGVGLDRVTQRWDAMRTVSKISDGAFLSTAAVFLLLPLMMVVVRGAPTVLTLPGPVWASVGRSLIVAFASTVFLVVLALPIAIWSTTLKRRSVGAMVEGMGYLTIAASPLVIGTGLFIISFRYVNPASLALPVTILVNAAMSLPFALRSLVPSLLDIEQNYGRLSSSLGMSVWSKMRLVVLPRLKRPLGFSCGLSAALSMGDLGVIALFSDPSQGTLPLMIFRLMGAYRMDDAAGAALLLLLLSLSLFWLFDRGGRTNAAG